MNCRINKEKLFAARRGDADAMNVPLEHLQIAGCQCDAPG
jgi:hypothetical protein